MQLFELTQEFFDENFNKVMDVLKNVPPEQHDLLEGQEFQKLNKDTFANAKKLPLSICILFTDKKWAQASSPQETDLIKNETFQ
ncbi:hypothetical protein V3C99_010170 [Haemonchus contortus]